MIADDDMIRRAAMDEMGGQGAGLGDEVRELVGNRSKSKALNIAPGV